MLELLNDDALNKLPKGTITAFEKDVLLLRRQYSSMYKVLTSLREKYPHGLKKKGRETPISEDDVYGVGYRIRERRRKIQLQVNFWNNVAKDKKLYRFITPMPKAYGEEPTKAEEMEE